MSRLTFALEAAQETNLAGGINGRRVFVNIQRQDVRLCACGCVATVREPTIESARSACSRLRTLVVTRRMELALRSHVPASCARHTASNVMCAASLSQLYEEPGDPTFDLESSIRSSMQRWSELMEPIEEQRLAQAAKAATRAVEGWAWT